MQPNQLKRFKIGASLITIGRYTYGFENLLVRQYGEGASLNIGAFCSISDKIQIFLGGNHRTDNISTYPFGHIYSDFLPCEKVQNHPSSNGDVKIGNDVWIGSGVTIMSGLTIGDGSVIAAGSVVTKNVGPYEIVGGNPAKLIRSRFSKEMIERLLQLAWWELPAEVIQVISAILASEATERNVLELLATYRNSSAV